MRKQAALFLAMALLLGSVLPGAGAVALGDTTETPPVAAEEQAQEETVEEPMEEPVEEPVEEPAEESVEEPAQGPATEPDGQSVSESGSEPESDPVDEPEDGAVQAPGNDATEAAGQEPVDKALTQSGNELDPASQASQGAGAGMDNTPVALDGLTEAELLALENLEEDDIAYVDGGEAVAYILTDGGEVYGQPETLIRRLLENGGGTLYLLCRVRFTVSDLNDEGLALLTFCCASENDQVVCQRADGGYDFWVEPMDDDQTDGDLSNGSGSGDGASGDLESGDEDSRHDTGDSSGDSSGNSSGDSSGNDSGNSSGNDTDDSSGNDTDDSSGNDTDDSSGNDTDDSSDGSSDDSSDNSSGDDTDNSTGNDTGNSSGDDPEPQPATMGFAQPQAQVQTMLTMMFNGSVGVEEPSLESEEGEQDSQPHEGQGEELLLTLTVTPPEGYQEDACFSEAVTFGLAGLPEEGNYAYAVSEYGGEPVLLNQNRFTVSGDGEYELSFLLVNGDTGETVAQADESYHFYLFTGDLYAGVAALSLTVEEDEPGLTMLLGSSAPALGSVQLSVTPPSDYADGDWVNVAPTFTLSGKPDDSYQYAVRIDGGSLTELGSQTAYTAPEGAHGLQFFLLQNGSQADASAIYNAWVDTAPPVIDAIAVESSTLYVTASDGLSGLYAISIDGGRAWSLETRLGSQTTWTSTIRSPDGIQAGQIIIRDKAGNRAANPNRIVINMDSAGETGEASVTISGGGGGGMGGTASRAVAHAKSDDRSTTAYNAVDLDDVDSLAMSALNVGDEALDLLLYGGNGSAALFTAGLAHWDGENGVSEAAASGDSTADTLVLSAVEGDETGDGYRWEVNGQVVKKLADSGIQYLVLQVGDNVTTLSTAGFTGGLRYDLWKAEGTPSKAFSYSIAMSPTPNAMSMTLLLEGQSYAVSGDSSGELYYYNVFSGSPDLLKEAFGSLAARNQG